ncbi:MULTISPECIES: hypothetical protein [unclassified Nocardioides]|uniref:hypothetical protein n=1 Tax=unclassified Nocardioides TaxID=2615069 RepID=UPI001154C96E|nr:MULTISPECIES: hypothetical protein [unclassified Nocardioides]TQK71882.1 hypothetical protein FBY23_3687 [Nocardioides sp. SLBN-35]WGY03922.1 hypothetical protein QI633_09160 [Nocardioides sp. QY071]
MADDLPRLERELALSRARVSRLERELASVQPLVQTARHLAPWDFTPYQVYPDGDWVAVDRHRMEELLAALAAIDHWAPWRTPIEPRPQP